MNVSGRPACRCSRPHRRPAPCLPLRPRVLRPVVDVGSRRRVHERASSTVRRRDTCPRGPPRSCAMPSSMLCDAALDGRLLGLVALAEEHRDRDRGEDADDDDHDQQLDEGEAPVCPSAVRSIVLSPTAARPRPAQRARGRIMQPQARGVVRDGSPADSVSPVALRPTLASGLPFALHTLTLPKYGFAGQPRTPRRAPRSDALRTSPDTRKARGGCCAAAPGACAALVTMAQITGR